MKPKMNDQRCGADPKSCKILNICPVDAISYREVKEAIKNRKVNCSSGFGCGCSCGSGKSCCSGSPFGRIYIDLDKCIECGLCAEQCCGKAIGMV